LLRKSCDGAGELVDDASVVAAFEAILAGAIEEYRLGKSAEFALDVRAHEEETDAEAPALALAQ